MPLELVFDHAQRRVAHDRIGAAHCGRELGGPAWSNVWIDPVTHSLMLRPGCLDEAWYTSNAGVYAKLAKADYTLGTPASWVEEEVWSGAGKFLTSQGVNEVVKTSAAVGLNRAIWLSWFAFGAGDNFVQMECGWSDGGTGAAGVSLRFYSGGDAEVWKDGTLLGTYKISGGTTSNKQANSYAEVLMLPCRGRDLLVWSSGGDGFVHTFEDIDEDDGAPAITANEAFWWYVPAGKAKVQCAKAKFQSSGYATTDERVLAEAPEASDVYERYDNAAWAGGANRAYAIYGHEGYGGTTGASAQLRTAANAAFVPDGATQNYLLRVDLTGDGDYTPIVYGASIGFDRVVEDTPGEDSEDLIDSVLAMSLSVPDSPSGVALDLEMRDPYAIEDGGTANFAIVSNRPVRLSNDFGTILSGRTDPVGYTLGCTEPSTRATLTARDQWKALENYRFRDPYPLAGLALEDAIGALVKLAAGAEDADLDLDATGYTLGTAPSADSDDWPIVIEIGDTAAEWVQRLAEDYATGYYYGFKPTASGIGFFFKDPDLLGTAEEVTLWGSGAEALAFGVAAEDVPRALYWSFSERALEPEANDVRVTGWDPRAQKPIQAYYPDYASQDPTLAVGARPNNWLGEIRHLGLVDGSITTQSLVNAACTAIFKKVSVQRHMAEWTSDMLIRSDGAPVWRGDCVRLVGAGTYRVESLSVAFEVDAGGYDSWYPTTYTGVLVKDEPL